VGRVTPGFPRSPSRKPQRRRPDAPAVGALCGGERHRFGAHRVVEAWDFLHREEGEERPSAEHECPPDYYTESVYEDGICTPSRWGPSASAWVYGFAPRRSTRTSGGTPSAAPSSLVSGRPPSTCSETRSSGASERSTV
jgi:hypothetical protein